MTDLMTEVREAITCLVHTLLCDWEGTCEEHGMTGPQGVDDRLLARLDGMTIMPAGEVERLREALKTCIDALDTVSAILAGVLDTEVISAQSILRHAAKEARDALGEEVGR